MGPAFASPCSCLLLHLFLPPNSLRFFYLTFACSCLLLLSPTSFSFYFQSWGGRGPGGGKRVWYQALLLKKFQLKGCCDAPASLRIQGGSVCLLGSLMGQATPCLLWCQHLGHTFHSLTFWDSLFPSLQPTALPSSYNPAIPEVLDLEFIYLLLQIMKYIHMKFEMHYMVLEVNNWKFL